MVPEPAPDLKLTPGASGSIDLLVAEADTALAAHSGDVAVLATPRIVALCEEASVAAVHDGLPEGATSVGMRVQLDHLAPCAIGTTVTASSKLDKVEGRRLTFSVAVSDDRGLVAAGKVTRVVVDRDRFLDKCS